VLPAIVRSIESDPIDSPRKEDLCLKWSQDGISLLLTSSKDKNQGTDQENRFSRK
jgi:hypothetical protein